MYWNQGDENVIKTSDVRLFEIDSSSEGVISS